jgi:hypothetical protein
VAPGCPQVKPGWASGTLDHPHRAGRVLVAPVPPGRHRVQPGWAGGILDRPNAAARVLVAPGGVAQVALVVLGMVAQSRALAGSRAAAGGWARQFHTRCRPCGAGRRASLHAELRDLKRCREIGPNASSAFNELFTTTG